MVSSTRLTNLRDTTGADTDFLVIHDHAETLRSDVDALAATSYLTPIREIAGLVYDVDTGTVTERALGPLTHRVTP